MTQPAVSRTLRQLRAVFDDPLLVSPGRNARLTDRAEALTAPLARALGDLDLLLKPARPFDLATEAVRIIINTADYVAQLLAPVLSEICAREAPHVVLEFTWTGTHNTEDLARVDFMIGPRAFSSSPWARRSVRCRCGADGWSASPPPTIERPLPVARRRSFRRHVTSPSDAN